MTYQKARDAYYKASDRVAGIRLDLNAGRISETEYNKRVKAWRKANENLARAKKIEGIN